MLHINIPFDGNSNLTFNKFEEYDIPAPPSGFYSEINNTVIMQFEDEQQAIDYAHDLDAYAESLTDHSSIAYLIIANIIRAISDDSFVQAYIQS